MHCSRSSRGVADSCLSRSCPAGLGLVDLPLPKIRILETSTRSNFYLDPDEGIVYIDGRRKEKGHQWGKVLLYHAMVADQHGASSPRSLEPVDVQTNLKQPTASRSIDNGTLFNLSS